MPVRLAIRFKTSAPVSPSSLKPKVIHGILFSLFSKEVGEFFHSPIVKPFSLFCPLCFKSNKEEIHSFTLEVNLLDFSLFPYLSRELLIRSDREFSVEGVKAKFQSMKAIKSATYEEILENGFQTKDLIIDFLTPTTFKKGKYDFILPEPYLIFKNLIKRWNAFSPRKIDYQLLQYVKENIIVAGCWIKSQKTEISPKAKITGFTGRVFLYATKEAEENRLLNALLQFAEFSGIGRKTTMGFGKAKFVV
jgi:CRISPR-associated endoribonuclease Cas6